MNALQIEWARSKTILLAVLCTSAASCASDPPTPEERLQGRIDSYTKAIEDVVDDPERAHQMLMTLEGAQAEFNRQVAELRTEREKLMQVARDYNAGNEELERILEGIRSRTVALADELEIAHFTLRDLATENEWDRIVRPRRKILGIF